VLTGNATATGGRAGTGEAAGTGGDALATILATGHELHLTAMSAVRIADGRSGLAESRVTATGALGEIEASARAYGSDATATGSIAATLHGHTESVKSIARAGDPAPTDAESLIAVHTDLTDAGLIELYNGLDAIGDVFGSAPLEAVAHARFAAVHGDAGDTQAITSTLDVEFSLFELDALGELTVALFDGDVIGPGFDTLQFRISVGDGTVIVAEDFLSEESAEGFFEDQLLRLGDLSGYADWFGNVRLEISVTVTGTQAGGGFDGDILFADVGGGLSVDSLMPFSGFDTGGIPAPVYDIAFW
jgi:hypothetical protein